MNSNMLTALLPIFLILAVVFDGIHGNSAGSHARSGRGRKPADFLYMIGCGDPPRFVDKRLYNCTDNTIVSLFPISTRRPKTMGTACSHDDLLTCNDVLHCGALQGYQCCGFERYRPEFQTCCQVSSPKYRIHDSKPEKNNICCGLDVFKRRSSKVSCEHPSSNDKFFRRKLPKIKRLGKDDLLCNRNQFQQLYVFGIDIENQVVEGNNRYLNATVSMLSRMGADTSSDPDHSGRDLPQAPMRIPFDKYSTWKKNLIGKSFISVTYKNYLKRAVFFLDRGDNLYRWNKSPKRLEKLARRLRKINRKCKIPKPKKTRHP